MTPDQHQKIRRYARDLGVVRSEDPMHIQIAQAAEILNACGLDEAVNAISRATRRSAVLDMYRVDL